MTKRNIKPNQGVIILYRLVLTGVDPCQTCVELVLTRVGLVLIRVDSCPTCIGLVLTCIGLVLIPVDLCWYSCIRIDLTTINHVLFQSFFTVLSPVRNPFIRFCLKRAIDRILITHSLFNNKN